MNRRSITVIGLLLAALVLLVLLTDGAPKTADPTPPSPETSTGEIVEPDNPPDAGADAEAPVPHIPPEPGNPGAGVLHGTVVDLEGRPVTRARVSAGWNIGTPVVEGAYRFQVSPGRGRLTAAAPGHPPVSADYEVAGGGETRVDLVLSPGGLILAGHVQDGNGRAVAGARVRVLGKRPDHYVLADLEYAVTDEGGAFLIEGLPEGDFRLHASAPFLRGGGPDAVKAGRRDIVITLELAGEIEGHFLLPVPPAPGEVLARTLTLWEGNAEPAFTAWGEGYIDNFSSGLGGDEFDGRSFRLTGILPGRYRLSGRVEGVGIGATAAFEVRAGETTRVEIKLEEAGVLGGLVVDATDGSPIPFALVLLADAVEYPMLGSIEDERAALMNFASATRTDLDGRYRFVGLTPGDYQILARASGYQEVRHPLVSVPREGDVDPLRLRGGGVVEIVLLDADGRPRGGVDVAINSGEETCTFTSTDETGRCRAESVTPGECWIQVGMSLGGSMICLARDVEAGETLRLVLREPAAESWLDGRLTRQGVPLPNCRVFGSFLDADGVEHRSSAETDADGDFRISPLLPGEVEVGVVLPGSRHEIPAITRKVVAGRNWLDLDLPGEKIRLRFIDRTTAELVPGVRVRVEGTGPWFPPDEEGEVAVEVLDRGDFALIAVHSDYGPECVTASPSATPKEVMLTPAESVFIDVVDLVGKDVPSADIEIRDESGLSLAGYAMQWDETDGSPGSSWFLLRLAPGRYRLRVTAKGFADFEDVLIVGAEEVRREIRLAPE